MRTAIIFVWLREHLILDVIDKSLRYSGMPKSDVYVYSERCDLTKTAAVNWNNAIAKTDSDYVVIMGDDCRPKPNWLRNAFRAMKRLPGGWGMVNFNDGSGLDRTSHVLMDRRVITEILDGEFIHPGYTFCCSDMEYMLRCQQAGRYIFAENAVVIHAHPMLPMIVPGVPSDEFYEKAYSPAERAADQELFRQRKARGWK